MSSTFSSIFLQIDWSAWSLSELWTAFMTFVTQALIYALLVTVIIGIMRGFLAMMGNKAPRWDMFLYMAGSVLVTIAMLNFLSPSLIDAATNGLNRSYAKKPALEAAIEQWVQPIPAPQAAPDVAPQATPTLLITVQDAPALPTAVPSLSEATTYTVVSGDSLAKIASRYEGLTVDALRAANGLTGDTIIVGQTLIIPVAPAQQTAVPTSESATPLPTVTPLPTATPTAVDARAWQPGDPPPTPPIATATPGN